MAVVRILLLLTSALLVSAQRPFYAGSKPIGFPEVEKKTTTPNPLEDKFGEVTTQRLPIEAQGDRDLIDRLSKLPIDQQPFWFINWQAYEANREKPQTYPLKPNPFADGIQQNTNAALNRNPGFAIPNAAKTGIVNTDNGAPNTNSNPNVLNTNLQGGNRFGTDNKDETKISSGNIEPSSINPGADVKVSEDTANTGYTKKPEAVVESASVLSDPAVKNTNVKVNSVPKYIGVSSNTKNQENYEDIEVKKLVKSN